MEKKIMNEGVKNLSCLESLNSKAFMDYVIL